MRKLAISLLSLALLVGCSRTAQQDASRVQLSAAPVDSSGPPVVPASAAGVVARATAPGAKATLVNVWATWCGPCREEFPALVAAAKRHPELRLVLVSADFDTQLPDVRKFLFAHGVTDTSYLKADGDQAFIDGLDPRWSGALPATLLYDAAGRKVAFWEGSADSARFETAIMQALQDPPSTPQESKP